MAKQVKINFEGYCKCSSEPTKRIKDSFVLDEEEFYSTYRYKDKNVLKLVQLRYPEVTAIAPGFYFHRDQEFDKKEHEREKEERAFKFPSFGKKKNEVIEEAAEEKKPIWVRILLFPLKLIWKLIWGIIKGLIGFLLPFSF